ncbi:MAG: hypothetical protein LAT64_12680 [Phycisphaerales bacterium]|nr:hypothetical protein [Planctomycetota bacterium]MCH8509609.1 hypothetical protein [Phycisphaerales bacterium]
MDTLILASTDYYQYRVGVVFIVVAGGVTLLGILLGVILSIYKTRQTEQSRREIAAYVAEGSISPEDGERLLKAGREPPKPWWACSNDE